MATVSAKDHGNLFNIELTENTIHEGGAALIAILAEPSHSDRQAELHASLCAYALRARHHVDDLTHVAMRPVHAFRDVKLIKKDVDFAVKQVERRMVAARMAIALLQETDVGPDRMILPSGLKRLSINQLAEFVLGDAGQSEASNVKTRFWRPSLPVIHLAVAAAVYAQHTKRAGGMIGFEHLLWSQESIETIIRIAEDYEALVLECPKITVAAADLVRVRLV